MSTAMTAPIYGHPHQADQTTFGLTPEVVQLRERLQKVELEMNYMRSTIDSASTASNEQVAAMNNRLTSQYQRIAALDDHKSSSTTLVESMRIHIKKIDEEIRPLLAIQREMERMAKRRALVIEAIKWLVPILVAALTVIEKLAPGFLKSLGI